MRVRVYIIQKVEPHAGSFHRSLRGSNLFPQKLSRKLPQDVFLKASAEEKYYLLFERSELFIPTCGSPVTALYSKKKFVCLYALT